MEKKMHQTQEGETVRIVRMEADDAVFRRLREIGWVPGACAKLYMRAPLGDPYAFWVNGSVFAVRLSGLKFITVRTEEANTCM